MTEELHKSFHLISNTIRNISIYIYRDMIHLRNTNNVSFDPTHYICRENRPCAYILLKTPEVLFCLLLLIVILRFLTVLSILATFCHWL